MMRFTHFEYKEKNWSPLDEVPFKLPSVQAHRGHWVGGERQNSLAALKTAQQAGYRMAEMDLRLTKDGHVVLYHDPVFFNVDQAQKIRALNLEELKSVIDITTLEDVFENLPHDFLLNLEIKNETKVDFSLEEKLVKLLKNSNQKDRILFSSFNPFSLAWMARLLPEVPRALLVTQEKEEGNSFFLRELSFISFVRPHFLNVRWEDLDHYRDIPSERKAVWTLNSLTYAKSLFERRKVASVISDSILPEQLEGA